MAQCGLSLTELLITAAILGIVAAASAASLGDMQRANRLRHSANRVAVAIEEAAWRARISQRDIQLDFDTGTGQLAEIIAEPPGVRRAALIYRLPAEVRFAEARFGTLRSLGSRLELRASGTATPGRVKMAETGGKQCTIVVSLRQAQRMVCDESFR